MDLILLAVPLFFGLIGLELLVNWIRGTGYYRLNDALSSLNLGLFSRLSGVIQALVPIALFLWVYEHARLWDVPDTMLWWVVAFLAYDLCYYWSHRMGHEVNVLWAAHVVHHSSEEYNLTTALRQTGTGFLSGIFYVPLALIGFDPLMVATVGALNLIYQFWVHTRLVDKLGVLDRSQ